jgi:two-component system, sensor histidine kinase and response regulator
MGRDQQEGWPLHVRSTVSIAVLAVVLGMLGIVIVHESVYEIVFNARVAALLCVGLAVTILFKLKDAVLFSGHRGIPESDSFLRKQQVALWRLTKSKNIHSGILEDALREVTECAAHTLEVERAGVWLFADHKLSLRCHDLFERSANRHSKGMALNAEDYPAYFEELAAERVIAAHDVKHDPRTAEFESDHLKPLGITAMLHAPIQSGGRMVGVICHAHVGVSHRWTLEEQQFANSMANLVSLALEAAERLQAELALRKSEERVRSIIDTALDAVIGMDERGHILDWNRRAETIFGWTREEALGRELGDTIIPPQYRDAHRRGLQHFLRSGEGPVLNKRIEITGLRRDGAEFPIELAISPLKTPTGYEFNAFVQDISERKRGEEELRRAKESAEAANRAKSQFLANMSHEIRTPMNGVLGMTDLMLGTTLTTKQRRFAETVRQSGQNLLRIVNEILDFAKVEAGKLVLERVDFDVYETIEEVIDLVAEGAQVKGLTLACEIEAGVPPMVKGDPGRLRQILINLVGNAIKFTEQGEVVVRVRLDGEPEARFAIDDGAGPDAEPDVSSAESVSTARQCRLRVSVADTGIGIPLHALPHIFEPFAQGDGSTTRKYGGTGLGLAIVKQLAEMMNGTASVESIPGHGSTFSFTARFELSAASSSAATGRRYDMDGLRVLIVDSNPTTRSILEHQMKAWRMHYGAAESGAEALAFLQHKTSRGTPYDLLILDSQLPDMDVLTFSRTVKSRADAGGVRLVMLSAVTGTEEADTLQQAGIQAILPKPFRQSRLYDCLATIMGGSLEEQAALRHMGPQHPEVRGVSHGRILLAEDNPVNQEVALGMLEALGCHADLASNGLEVLDALTRTAYDVILMDCQMPEMDGFEATRRIRELEASSGLGTQHSALHSRPPRHLPIVAVTAHAITGDRERCLTAGMGDYLSKPFVQDQLHAVLLRWLPQSTADTPPKPERSTFDVRRPDPNPQALNLEPRTSNLPLGSYGEAPTIDPRAWDSIRSLQRPGQPDMLGKVIGKYLTSSQQLIETMRLAVPQGDAAALHRTAHSLKSSSATLGALRLSALCKEVEALGRANALEGITTLWGKLEAEHVLVQEALTAELHQVKA